MRRAVSVSLGSASRDKKVVVNLNGALTAYAGKGRPLSIAELNDLIDKLGMRPTLALVKEQR